MRTGLIELYDHSEDGFHPVLVDDSWQVSILNYSPDYDISQLNCLLKHQQSDLGISLLTGEAVLIFCEEPEAENLNTMKMERGRSYHIPQNVWYSFVMSEGCQLFFVGRPHAQIDDVMEYPLTEEQVKVLSQKVNLRINDAT